MSTPVYITSKENIQYLTGFTGSKSSILLTPEILYFFTDARYFEETKKSIRLFGAFCNDTKSISYADALGRLERAGYHPKIRLIRFEKSGAHPLPALLEKHKIASLRFEKHHITYAQYLGLKKLARDVKLLPSFGVIEDLRAEKTPEEIEYTRKAQEITEKIFITIKKTVKPGQTEKDIEQKIGDLAKKFGADGLAFDSIVAFGENSAVPHHRTGSRKLRRGDLILIDMGVKFKGYHADMTRVIFTKKPEKEQEKCYDLVRNAHLLAVSLLKPGAKAGDIEAKIRIFLRDHERFFTHALGHGVGLQIHESPSLSEKAGGKKNPQILKENMLLTIEPGIYLNGKFGIRLENIYLIEKNGAMNLNKLPIDLPHLRKTTQSRK